MAADVTTLQLLLSEAQNEISHLRTDVFNTRRLAEERRQSEQNLLKTNESLKSQLAQATAQVTELQAQVPQLQSAQAQVANLEQLSQQLKKELSLALQAKKILQQELQAEREERQQVTSVKASLEAERARLLKAKDDLTAALRVAQRKAEEAEDELLRAEEEAQVLKAELKALHAHASSGGASQAEESGQYSSVHENPPSDQPWNTSHGLSASTIDSGLSRRMLEQVEHERSKAAALVVSLQDSKAENIQLQQQLDMLAITNAQLKQQLVQLSKELSQAQSTASGRVSASGVDAYEAGAAPAQMQQQTPQSASSNGTHTPHQADSAPVGPSTNNDTASNLQPLISSQGGQLDQPSNDVAGMSVDQHPNGLVTSAVISHQRNASSSSASTDEAADGHKHLLLQVSKLKASRDKLLEQIDRQWEEIDRLIADNRGLSDELDRLQQLVSCWEWQAQHSLAAEERLKEMLEEAGGWAADGGSKRGARDLDAMVLAERTRSAELELQVRALAAELLRSQQASKAFGKAVLPSLSSIEHRLSMMQQQAAAHAAGQAGNRAGLTQPEDRAMATPKQRLQAVQ